MSMSMYEIVPATQGHEAPITGWKYRKVCPEAVDQGEIVPLSDDKIIMTCRFDDTSYIALGNSPKDYLLAQVLTGNLAAFGEIPTRIFISHGEVVAYCDSGNYIISVKQAIRLGRKLTAKARV